MVWSLTPRRSFQVSILLLSVVNVFLYLSSAITSHSLYFSYLLWNLFLAWLPLLISIRLVEVLKTKLWSSWEGIGLSILWMLFLPNSFYMISDFIHLHEVAASGNIIVYDAIAFTSIIFTAIILGFASLYLIHLELKKRLSTAETNVFIGLIVLICSLAIYVGRDLRWNSWDVITNPGGLIYDLSNHLAHLNSYPQIIAISGLFFVLISSMYILAWNGIKYIRAYS